MSSDTARLGPVEALRRWRNGLIASPRFQSWASKFPLTRRMARADGARLMDLVAGFVHSQVLYAVVELELAPMLQDRPQSVDAMALRTGISADRIRVLAQAAASLGLFVRRKDGTYGLGRLGAALIGVPGLTEMIRHHKVLYADLADPVAVLKGEDTALAGFWPYVFGADGGDVDAGDAEIYSDLMAQSQGLVAEETLRTVRLDGVRHLLDVGGGTGAFLKAVGESYPVLRMTLFDLPSVVIGARSRLSTLVDRIEFTTGSFRDDSLPEGADAISLIRVLFDHQDETVRGLLARVYEALPPNGRLIISEPMSGGAQPNRATDAYFSFYTMAMQTGKVRSQQEISALLTEAGFAEVSTPRSARPFVTSVVTARKL